MSLNRIALLRGVNVGGNNRVPMPALKALAEALGLERPVTLLQSGILVFGSAASPSELEPLLEEAIAASMGVRCAVLVRSAEVWREVLAANPFPVAAQQRPQHLLIFALRREPTQAEIVKAETTIRGGERLAVVGTHAFIDFAESVGTSRFDPAKLGVATGRNMNTALKLAALTA